MKIEEVIQSDKVDFSGIPSSYYLIGLLSAFENRFQAMADNMMQEISWKQADFVDFDSLDPIV